MILKLVLSNTFFLFSELYSFASKIREKSISKDNFTFENALYLNEKFNKLDLENLQIRKIKLIVYVKTKPYIFIFLSKYAVFAYF